MTDIQQDPGIYPSDWKPPSTILDIQKIFEAHSFFDGRMIGGSKTGYSSQHADELIVFNANVLMPGYGKVWYGDLNLTEDYLVLKDIAKSLNSTLYVLWESDGRFGEENKPFDELIKKSVWNTDELKPTLEWYKKSKNKA
jgi:hypothetical protein|tara:strand:+ start:56 stop:475 length:420 start_codon:yes stop_codon:yes gene_type:complete